MAYNFKGFGKGQAEVNRAKKQYKLYKPQQMKKQEQHKQQHIKKLEQNGQYAQPSMEELKKQKKIALQENLKLIQKEQAKKAQLLKNNNNPQKQKNVDINNANEMKPALNGDIVEVDDLANNEVTQGYEERAMKNASFYIDNNGELDHDEQGNIQEPGSQKPRFSMEL